MNDPCGGNQCCSMADPPATMDYSDLGYNCNPGNYPGDNYYILANLPNLKIGESYLSRD